MSLHRSKRASISMGYFFSHSVLSCVPIVRMMSPDSSWRPTHQERSEKVTASSFPIRHFWKRDLRLLYFQTKHFSLWGCTFCFLSSFTDWSRLLLSLYARWKAAFSFEAFLDSVIGFLTASFFAISRVAFESWWRKWHSSLKIEIFCCEREFPSDQVSRIH